ncbi:hypothetical protein RAS2_30110 [Phycisphaerae bacterium RAS2]|nr:hypothetical protein RAS2_30110 [Phycisphaerae bacterium RAS2]
MLEIKANLHSSHVLEIAFSDGSNEAIIYPSHIPDDSLKLLAEAAVRVLGPAHSTEFVMYDEPGEYLGLLEATGDQLEFKLLHFRDSVRADRAQAQPLFSTCTTAIGFARAVSRMLATLQAGTDEERFAEVWPPGFPQATFDLLRNSIRRFRDA